MTKLKPPPNERKNYASLNEGQKRYAWEQYKLARVRRGLPIDHPVPEVAAQNPQTSEEDVPQVEEIGTGDGSDSDSDYNQSMPAAGVRASADSASTSSSEGGARGGKKRKLASKHPGTGGDLDNDESGSGNNRASAYEIPSPLVSIHSNIRYYRKVHRVLTYGIAYKILSFNLDNSTTPSTGLVLSTPLCEIPWNRLFMYLNQSEYNLLPSGSTVEKVRCEIKVRNVRVAFPTNASDSNLATLNQIKSVVYGVGLNKSCTSMPVTYTAFESAQPMIPSTFAAVSNETFDHTITNMYGPRDTSSDFSTEVPRHQVGIPQVLPIYMGLVYAPNKGANNVEKGWECLQSLYTEVDADSVLGSTVVSVEYTPTYGPCTQPHQPFYTGLPTNNTKAFNVTIPRGSMNYLPHETGVGFSQNQTPYTVSESQSNFVVNATNYSIRDLIEKSQTHFHGLYNHPAPVVQDSLHIGIQPTVALTTANLVSDNTNSNFTDTQGYFDIICEMEVNTSFPSFRPHAKNANVGEANIVLSSNIPLRTDYPTFGGLYSH